MGNPLIFVHTLLLVIAILIIVYGLMANKKRKREFEKKVQDAITEANLANKEIENVHSALKSAPFSLEFGENKEVLHVVWSNGIRHMLGYEDEKDFPNNPYSLVNCMDDEDKSVVNRDINQHLILAEDDSFSDIQCKLRSKNGEQRWYRIRIHTRWNYEGNLFLIYGVLMDIDDQKKVEESNTIQNSVVQALTKDCVDVLINDFENDLSVAIKLNGKMIDNIFAPSNTRSYSKMWDYFISKYVVEEDKEELKRELRAERVLEIVHEGKEHTANFRINYNGEHYCQIKYIMLDGKVVSAVKSIDDIVKAERSQQEILRNALWEAQSANRAKTNFLFNMSHDIRTPMNAIIGYTNLVRKNIDNKEKVEEYLSKVEVAEDTLLKLVNNVLDMARIENDKVTVTNTPTDISNAMEKLETIFKEDAVRKGVTISSTNDYFTPYIYQDEIHVAEIVTNIVSNAIKYTPRGGYIKFGLIQRPTDEEDMCEVEFFCKDTGIGMSEEFLEHAFESFSRERNSTISGIQGTGLGLGIVKKLTDLMCGKIDIKSEQGVGTHIRVIIKHKIATEEDVNMRFKKETKENFNIAGRRLLLVEDNELNMEIAREILSEMGLVVEEVFDGQQAVDRIDKSLEDLYDFILMDVQMPVMDGYEATRTIRKHSNPKKASIPIIAMTANAFDEDRENAYRAGMDAHVSKPIVPDVLRQTITDVLTKKGKYT